MNLASNFSCPALISSLNTGCNIEDGQFCKASPCFPASTQATLETVLQLANSKIHTHLHAANSTLELLGCFCCCTMPGTCITRDMRAAHVKQGLQAILQAMKTDLQSLGQSLLGVAALRLLLAIA